MGALLQSSVQPTPGAAVFPRLQLRTLHLQCPTCLRPMGVLNCSRSLSEPQCPACDFVMKNELGIWKALAPAREERFQQFVEEYQIVRRSEGRGSPGGLYYLALPYKDITGRNARQWKIRAKSFRFFQRKILPQIENGRAGGLDILDLGAGNCWLSYRLALCGHWPVAADLRNDGLDGLGAARHYLRFLSRPFPRFLAEMDQLPFAKAQFDLVIFNASFHYSEDYETTLGEALRCLRRPGHILLIDSPFYHSEESGRAMVAERRQAYLERYRFPSDSIPTRSFLTGYDLEQLARRCGIRWQLHKPWYGVRWGLRPARAWLGRRREPAKFYLIWGTVEAA